MSNSSRTDSYATISQVPKDIFVVGAAVHVVSSLPKSTVSLWELYLYIAIAYTLLGAKIYDWLLMMASAVLHLSVYQFYPRTLPQGLQNAVILRCDKAVTSVWIEYWYLLSAPKVCSDRRFWLVLVKRASWLTRHEKPCECRIKGRWEVENAAN